MHQNPFIGNYFVGCKTEKIYVYGFWIFVGDYYYLYSINNKYVETWKKSVKILNEMVGFLRL